MGKMSSEKTFLQKPYTPTPAPHIKHTMLVRYKDFKYMQTLHQPYTNPTPTLHPFLHL